MKGLLAKAGVALSGIAIVAMGLPGLSVLSCSWHMRKRSGRLILNRGRVYTLGSINGQNGWTATGASGSGCATYDEGVAPSLGTLGFGEQSFRISNAVTSGCFGDQAFATPLVNAVGESDATDGTYSPGALQPHFEMQFDIASTLPDAQQPGLSISVSPDRGDGSRMSYLRFDDESDGIHVFFYDVEGTMNVGVSGLSGWRCLYHWRPVCEFRRDGYRELDRSGPHTIKLTLDAIEVRRTMR